MVKIKILPAAPESELLQIHSEKILAQLLFNRGITTPEQVEKFLHFSEEQLQHPSNLSDIKKAVERIKSAKEKSEKVYIYGDYDVDGVCATSILWDFLYRKLGVDTMPYIPSRFEEGYGLSKAGLDFILENGGKLVITVDCGIKDATLIKEYSQKGLDFIVTDHHTLDKAHDSKEILPEAAVAIVHPKHPQSAFEFTEICGTAVAWKLIFALYEHFKEDIDFKDFNPDDYLDLVSIATVTDIMPLTNENRVLVSKGLNQVSNTKNIGLSKLMEIAGVQPSLVDTYHYGFVIGPRINAAGRVEHALSAVRLFTSNDTSFAERTALYLSELNLKRQELTEELIREVESKINESKLIFAYGDEWPEGIVGLVAGKLLEKYHRPVIVASVGKDGLVVGSARSVSGLNITEAIGKFSNYLERFGGHAQAAGFSLKKENLEKFETSLREFIDSQLTDEDLIKVIEVDMEMNLDNLSFDLINLLEQLKPFGFGNKRPVFLFSNIEIYDIQFIGREKNHVKIIPAGYYKANIEIMGFRKAEKLANIKRGDKISFVADVDVNEWNGRRSIQIKLQEII